MHACLCDLSTNQTHRCSLSDEELSEGPQPPTPPPRRTSTNSWGLGCIGRQDAQSRSFSNIADGLRLAHAQALAVAGIVHQTSSSSGSAPFRRGLRASFHGRGTPRHPNPEGPHLSCPTTPASIRRGRPAPPASARRGQEEPSGQLLSVQALLQHVSSLRPCDSPSPRVLPRPLPNSFHRRSLRAPPRLPIPSLHRSLENFRPSSSDSDSEMETSLPLTSPTHTQAAALPEDQSGLSSGLSTHSLPQCGPHTTPNHAPHHPAHRQLPCHPHTDCTHRHHRHHRHHRQIHQYHRLMPEDSDHNHHHNPSQHPPQSSHSPPQPSTHRSIRRHRHHPLHHQHHHHLHHCVLPSSVSTLKLSPPSAATSHSESNGSLPGGDRHSQSVPSSPRSVSRPYSEVVGSAESLVGRVLADQGLGKYCDPDFVRTTSREIAEALEMTSEEMDRAAHNILSASQQELTSEEASSDRPLRERGSRGPVRRLVKKPPSGQCHEGQESCCSRGPPRHTHPKATSAPGGTTLGSPAK
ncbi:Voltage-dependent calcium channel type D subunit alpha-1 [Portunus trituberculatus]|uniref:Voltage-dependent calcium channel type D subunit alpha-1 n=1 Tax=Portunus trituberculatus TaxID=210409 RepID=A0A5B7CFT1_PORTR|nr:Voltage-dependent calcium channel type D subunit alpha-1 [Portunus trituberculatus]